MAAPPGGPSFGGVDERPVDSSRGRRGRGRRRALLAGLGVPFALAALAGCGGETRRAETETETAPVAAQPAPTPHAARAPVAKVSDPRRLAYIRQTDAVCARFDPERGAERRQVADSPDIEGAVRAYEKDSALGAAELRRIEAVPPPPGDAALLRADVFAPIRRQLALRAQIKTALAAVDVTRLEALRAESDDISRALSAFARGYGWRTCGGD
jgi:hypothetical protein